MDCEVSTFSSELNVNHYDHGRLPSSWFYEFVFQSVTNSSSFCYHPDNHTIPTTDASGFKPLIMFAVIVKALYYIAIVFEANITRALIGEA